MDQSVCLLTQEWAYLIDKPYISIVICLFLSATNPVEMSSEDIGLCRIIYWYLYFVVNQRVHLICSLENLLKHN